MRRLVHAPPSTGAPASLLTFTIQVAGPPVIGLDVGTRAAVFRSNQVKLIKDELGNDCTPAFVGFSLQPDNSSTPLLGRHAYDLAQRNLTHPVHGLKKLLGRKPDDPVIIAERGWPFKIAADPDGLAAVSIPTKSSSKLYKPEELLYTSLD